MTILRTISRWITANPTAAVTLVIALGSGGFSVWTSIQANRQSRDALEQTRKLTEHQNTLTMLERFSSHYFPHGGSRMIALYVVDVMGNEGLKSGLRRLVATDIMRENFGGSKPVTAFNRDHEDWVILGDALFNLRRYWHKHPESADSFRDWWCERRQRYLDRWPHHEQHLKELYAYLDDWNLHDRHYKNIHPAPPKMVPCETAARIPS